MANVSAPVLESQEDFQVPAQPKIVSFGSRACAALVDAAIVIAIPYLLACAGFVAIDGASSMLNGKPFVFDKAVQQVLFPEQLWKAIGSIEPVLTAQNRDALLGQLAVAAQPFLNVMAVTSVLSLVFFAFNHLMLPSIDGQSLGKKLAGLRIVQEDGAPLSLNRLFLRNVLGYGLSSIFLVGYLFALVDPQRRAWHDYISKTRVVWDSKDTALRGGFISSFMFHLLAIASSILLIYFLKFLILWLKAIGLPIPALTPPTQYEPMEYTLSNTDKRPKTERKSNVNSVAGGKRNPKLAVSPGRPSAAKSQPKASKQPAAKSEAEAAPKEAPKQPKRPKVEPPKPRPVVVRQKPPEPKPEPKKPEPKQEEPKPLLRQDPEPTPKPKPEPKVTEPPKPVATKPEPTPPEPAPPQEEKAEPAPPEEAPQPRTTRRSAVGGSGLLEDRRRTRKSDSSSLGGLSSRSTGSGPGGVGNSDVFNPDRDGPGQGIDAAQDVDFGPYMAELQRRVKRNWIPPEQGNSRRSVLRFSISRNGEISNLKVGKTSGNPDSDAAAMDAVRRAAPFKTLPAGYKGRTIDIQFTFDINVFGGDVTSN